MEKLALHTTIWLCAERNEMQFCIQVVLYAFIINELNYSKMGNIKKRLEELRTELRNECISYGELAELYSLVEHIDKDDVELLQAAGVPEALS